MRAGADDVLAKPPDPAELERGLIAAERLTGMHRRMRDDARRDPLTGVGSRLRLDEDLAALCARAARYGHAYCVAMIGVEPGGERGAAARRARRSAQQIRSGDVLYRSGPAQFVVLLPEQGLETANLAAERLRDAAADAPRPTATAVSVGIVTTGRRAGARCAARARRGGAGRAPPSRAASSATTRPTPARCGCSSPTTTPCHG